MKIGRVAVSFLVALLMGASVASAAVMDLYDEFPVHQQGENGFYAYGYTPSTGDYRPLFNVGGGYFSTQLLTSPVAPMVFRSGQGLLNSDPWLYMGTLAGSQEDVVLGYKVSQAGTYTLSGAFDKHISEALTPYIKHDNTLVWQSDVSVGNNITKTYNVSFFANPGDYIYYGLAAGNTSYADSVYLKGTIDMKPTPIPAALPLLGSGLAVVAMVRRRMKG